MDTNDSVIKAKMYMEMKQKCNEMEKENVELRCKVAEFEKLADIKKSDQMCESFIEDEYSSYSLREKTLIGRGFVAGRDSIK